ncbi:MAG TPA: hypothetical protein VMA98_12835 [Candidatus Acidoferrales bacterium]|nr:hypothetical protein [Candidatus Acidoferrales bacterium]
MIRHSIVALFAITALNACSAAGSATPGTATDLCNTQAIPQFSLVSPASGATGVPDSTAALLFSGTPYTNVGPPSITLTSAAGATQTLTTFNRTNSGYSVPLPALSGGTTYTVGYVVALIENDTSSQCSPTETFNEGSFTTQ